MEVLTRIVGILEYDSCPVFEGGFGIDATGVGTSFGSSVIVVHQFTFVFVKRLGGSFVYIAVECIAQSSGSLDIAGIHCFGSVASKLPTLLS